MADCMGFPDDWHDFLDYYSFNDEDEVYTNGSRLIQAFRVEQLIEHLMAAQEPRVMTAEDMWTLKFNDTVILEQKIPSLLIPAIVRDNIKHDDTLEVLQVVTASTDGTANADYGYYGKTWRCWTSRPTDAEREATLWMT